MIYLSDHIDLAWITPPAILVVHPLDQAKALKLAQQASACLPAPLLRQLRALGASPQPISAIPALGLDDKLVVVYVTTTSLMKYALVSLA